MTGCIFHDDNGVQCERDPGHRGKHAYDLAMGGQHERTGGLVPAARIAELERAAETSRTEHAEVVAEFAEETLAHELTREAVKAAVDEWNGVSAALGLATARIRELEEMLGFDTPWPVASVLERLLAAVDHGLKAHDCDHDGWEVDQGAVEAARAIVARIEKTAKGTT